MSKEKYQSSPKEIFKIEHILSRVDTFFYKKIIMTVEGRFPLLSFKFDNSSNLIWYVWVKSRYSQCIFADLKPY